MDKLKFLLSKYWITLQAVSSVKNEKTRRQVMRILARKKDFRSLMRLIMEKAYFLELRVTKQQEKQLRKYQEVIKRFAYKRTRGFNSRTTKNDIGQVGGFLPYLLPILAPYAIDFIADAIGKKISSSSS